MDIKELFRMLNSTGRGWNMTEGVVYTTSQRIQVVENCAGFMFTNVGDVIATVNGLLVFPSATPATALGDSRSVALHVLDMFKGHINLSFRQPIAGMTPGVEIVQFYYIPGDFDIINF